MKPQFLGPIGLSELQEAHKLKRFEPFRLGRSLKSSGGASVSRQLLLKASSIGLSIRSVILLKFVILPIVIAPMLLGCQTGLGLSNSPFKSPLARSGAFFSRPATLDRDQLNAQTDLARQQQDQGNPAEAIAHLQRAVELSDHDPRLTVELGELYLSGGQWLPAKRQAELALQRDRRYAPAWALLGKTQRAKGNLTVALASYQRAVGLDSTQLDTQLEIVSTYQQMGQPMRALSAAEQLLSQYPLNQQPDEVIVAKSVALMDLHQLPTAIDLLQTASEKDTAASEVFLRLGQAQLLAGQISQARMTLSRAKTAYPTQREFDSLLAELQSAQPRVASLK